MPNSGYHGFWVYLYDWQVLIGAVLAVFAGSLAYYAAHQQADISRRQFEDAVRERKRALARRALADSKLLAALLAQIMSDLVDAKQMAEHTLSKGPGLITTVETRKACMRPVDLSLAWSSLPLLMAGGVGIFLDLASRVDKFRGEQNQEAKSTMENVLAMEGIAGHLKMEIESASRQTFKVLQDTEGKA